jgi:hypothetical protein
MLLARGEQDDMINQNPEYSFFSRDIKTYTQFGTDWLLVTNNDKNSTNFIYDGMTMDIHVPVNGDLLTEVYLRFKLDVTNNWDYSANTGSFTTNTYALETIMSILDSVQFLVNNKLVSELDSVYLMSYYDLYLNQQQKNNLVPLLSYEYAKQVTTSPTYVYLYVPIPFWFHHSPNNAFPMWALKNNEITIKVKLNKYKGSSNRSIRDIEMLYQYAFLTPEEKEKFTNLPLEYIIKQVNVVDKFNVTPNSSYKVSIPQTNFIEYFLWNIALYEKQTSTSSNIGFRKFIDGLDRASITINGNELIDADKTYYSLIQRYQHFYSDSAMKMYSYSDISSANGLILLPNEYFLRTNLGNQLVPILPLYTYSFGLEPIENKDTGFLSTEKFTHGQFTFKFNSLTDITNSSLQYAECRVYMMRHNILRVQDGNVNILFS